MEKSNESASMINMFTYPVFCVKNGVITEANHYAQQLLICVGTSISELLKDCIHEYEDFCGCCIGLTLYVSGAAVPAVAIRLNETDVFHLYGDTGSEGIRAMALVAKELSEPLTELLNAEELQKAKAYHPAFKKSLYQLQRITSNISAANAYTHGRPYGMEICNLSSRFHEILMETEQLATVSNRKLHYICPNEAIYCPVDLEILEKAIYNLISNAIKGSPENSTIHVTIALSGDRLRFSIQNTDNGLGDGNDLFSRYMRAPQIEDGRHGIGLGIPIAQLAASTHNGTLLMDRPDKETIRFTLTISTRTQDGDILRSPVVQIDHHGGFHRSFVELADVLPSSAFEDL